MADIQLKPTVAFRVDASTRIGTGHVMRCLTLAGELAELGCAVRFICRAHAGHMADEIRTQGHELVLLPLEDALVQKASGQSEPDYAPWLGAPWERDADQTLRAIEDMQACWLVADHFAISAPWERRIKQAAQVKVMIIDGLANRPHDCELLLDQTWSPQGAARWDGLLPASCRRLVGPQFALMRPEFIRALKSLRPRTAHVKRIFIAFGGVDEPNVSSLALAALNGVIAPEIAVDLVIGVGNPHREQLLAQCRAGQNLHAHVQPPDMAALMANADLAISAGGTQLLEQCLMQLPSLVVSIAANQESATQALHELGAVLYVGKHDAGNPAATQQAIRQALIEMLAAPQQLVRMQSAARELMKRPELSISQILLDSAHETH